MKTWDINLWLVRLLTSNNLIMIKLIPLRRKDFGCRAYLFYIKVVVMSGYIKIGMDVKSLEWLYLKVKAGWRWLAWISR